MATNKRTIKGYFQGLRGQVPVGARIDVALAEPSHMLAVGNLEAPQIPLTVENGGIDQTTGMWSCEVYDSEYTGVAVRVLEETFGSYVRAGDYWVPKDTTPTSILDLSILQPLAQRPLGDPSLTIQNHITDPTTETTHPEFAALQAADEALQEEIDSLDLLVEATVDEVNNHETRIDNLEAGVGGGGVFTTPTFFAGDVFDPFLISGSVGAVPVPKSPSIDLPPLRAQVFDARVTLGTKAGYAYPLSCNTYDDLATDGTMTSISMPPIPVSPTLTPGAGILTAGTYAYRVSATMQNGETIPCAEVTIALTALSAPSAPTLASGGAGTLPAGTYTYQIVAVRNGGKTVASTASSPLTVGANGKIVVSWSPVSTATGYEVYRSNGGAYQLIGTVAWNVAGFADDGTATPGAAPQGSNNTTGVLLTWTPATRATGYRVYGRTAGAELFLATVTDPTWMDEGTGTPAGAMPMAEIAPSVAAGRARLRMVTTDGSGITAIKQVIPATITIPKIAATKLVDDPVYWALR